MSYTNISSVLAEANARMVEPDPDVTGGLASLLASATDALGTDAAAILVDVAGALDVLAATSHRVADLEAYQIQSEEGPCLDAIRTGSVVHVEGAGDLSRRWPRAGTAIVEAGYSSVHATPLRWQGHAIGALNLFGRGSFANDHLHSDSCAVADAATLILATGRLDSATVADGVSAALEDRALVEQAKGALAHVLSIGMAAAFDEFTVFSRRQGMSLGQGARRVMDLARAGRLDESRMRD